MKQRRPEVLLFNKKTIVGLCKFSDLLKLGNEIFVVYLILQFNSIIQNYGNTANA